MLIEPISRMNVGNIAPPEELAIVIVFVAVVKDTPEVGASTGEYVIEPVDVTLNIYIHLALLPVADIKNIPLELFPSVAVPLALLEICVPANDILDWMLMAVLTLFIVLLLVVVPSSVIM